MTLPLLLLATWIGLGLAMFIWFRARALRREYKRGWTCTNCGYDIYELPRGTPCPECGAPYPDADPARLDRELHGYKISNDGCLALACVAAWLLCAAILSAALWIRTIPVFP